MVAFLLLTQCFECHDPSCLPGLPGTSGQCAAGFYCQGGAALPKPTDGVSGNVCPVGAYCSEYPVPAWTEDFMHITSETLSMLRCCWVILRAWWPTCHGLATVPNVPGSAPGFSPGLLLGSSDVFVSVPKCVSPSNAVSFTSASLGGMRLINACPLPHSTVRSQIEYQDFTDAVSMLLCVHLTPESSRLLLMSILLLFPQLQPQQDLSSAQLAPFPACQGGQCSQSASLALLASIVRNLA